VDQVQEIANRIFHLVNEAPDKNILGVRLGASLRAHFPAFQPLNFRCRNLRHFISTYVPSVSENRRSGADLLYTVADVLDGATPIAQNQADVALGEAEYVRLPTNAHNWKAYSNPAHPFVVVANLGTGILQTHPEGQLPLAPWVVIPKPTPEFHLEVASEFVSSQPEPLRTTLGALLHDPKWYVRFSAVATKNGLGARWTAFRRTKLIESFKSSLVSLAVPPAHKFAPPSESASYNANQGVGNHMEVTHGPDASEASFRDLVRKIVSELPISDLRSLKLPVGAVFDALRKQ
jgi:hypothetical protein